jgi:hypothetical protein
VWQGREPTDLVNLYPSKPDFGLVMGFAAFGGFSNEVKPCFVCSASIFFSEISVKEA